MPSEHALLSASDADRWIHCPRSVRLTQAFQDSGSAEAEEGTVAHALAEMNLRFEYEGFDTTDELEYDKLLKRPLYNKAMVTRLYLCSVFDTQASCRCAATSGYRPITEKCKT